MDPKDIAASAARLRASTCALFDELEPDDLEVTALPGWTVADVFRHLAEADRGSVRLAGLRKFLPARGIPGMESGNDDDLARLRAAPLEQTRRELEVWGKRLRLIIRTTPKLVTRLRIPTIYGRVGLDWFAALRVYDEWTHQWDIAQALGRPEPDMDDGTRAIIAEFLYRELATRGLVDGLGHDGVVQVSLVAAGGATPWRYDLTARRFGPQVQNIPSATIESDVVTWLLVRTGRRDWRSAEEAGDVRISGSARAIAEAVMAVVPAT